MAHVDLNRLRAERQSSAEPFTFDFGDHEYRLPPRMDIRVVALLAEGEVYRALQLLLGKEQWEQILAEADVLDDATLKDLLDAYARHQGADLGESSAST